MQIPCGDYTEVRFLGPQAGLRNDILSATVKLTHARKSWRTPREGCASRFWQLLTFVGARYISPLQGQRPLPEMPPPAAAGRSRRGYGCFLQPPRHAGQLAPVLDEVRPRDVRRDAVVAAGDVSAVANDRREPLRVPRRGPPRPWPSRACPRRRGRPSRGRTADGYAGRSLPAATSIGSQTLMPDSIQSGISSPTKPSLSMPTRGTPAARACPDHRRSSPACRTRRAIAGEIIALAL